MKPVRLVVPLFFLLVAADQVVPRLSDRAIRSGDVFAGAIAPFT